MPKSCCVPGCHTNKQKNQNLKFYTFPLNENRRRLWINAIKRAYVDVSGNVNKNKSWSPKTKSNYVCSLHFISGKYYEMISYYITVCEINYIQ